MKPLEKVLISAAFVIGILGAAIFLYLTCIRIPFPYMLNLGEPALDQNIRFLFEGKIPYHDLNEPPYSLVPYGPVYIHLAAFLKHFWPAPFVSGRIVGFFSTILISALLFLILKKLTKKNVLPILLAASFLIHPYTIRWGVQVNVDMTAVMLGLAAFFFFYLFLYEKPKNFYLWAGIFLCTASFFTKSSSLSAPAAFFFVLLWQKRFREALVFAGVLGIAVISIYMTLQLWTNGQYFYHTSFEIAHRSFFPQFIYRYWRVSLESAWLPVLASSIFIFLGFKNKKHHLFFLYLLFSLLLTFSLGKQGSDTNYFLEWSIASGLALGVILEEARGNFKIALLLLTIAQLAIWINPNLNVQKVQEQFQENKEFYDKISVNIRKVPGEILSEDMGLLVANGKEIVYEPFPMGQMSYSKIWNQELILQKLNRQDFSLAILYFYAPALKANRTFTPEFMEAFKKNYHFIGRVAYPWDKSKDPQNLFFYSPNKRG